MRGKDQGSRASRIAGSTGRVLGLGEKRAFDARIAEISDAEICRRWDTDDLSRLCLLYQQSLDSRIVDRILSLQRVKHMIEVKSKGFFLKDGDQGDLIAAANFGVFQAIANYDPSKGACYSHCCNCVDRHLITAVKTSTRRKHSVMNEAISLDSHVGNKDESTEDVEVAISKLLRDSLARSRSAEKVFFDSSVESQADELAKVCGFRGFQAFVLRMMMGGYSYAEIIAGWHEQNPHDHRRKDTKSVDNAFCRIKRKIHDLIDQGYDDPMVKSLESGWRNRLLQVSKMQDNPDHEGTVTTDEAVIT